MFAQNHKAGSFPFFVVVVVVVVVVVAAAVLALAFKFRNFCGLLVECDVVFCGCTFVLHKPKCPTKVYHE